MAIKNIIGELTLSLDLGRSALKFYDGSKKMSLSAGFDRSATPSGNDGEICIDGEYFNFNGDGMVEDDPLTSGYMGIRSDAMMAKYALEKNLTPGVYRIKKMSVTCQPGSIAVDGDKYKTQHARGTRKVQIYKGGDKPYWTEYEFIYPAADKIVCFPQAAVVATVIFKNGEIKEGEELLIVDIGGRSMDYTLVLVKGGKMVIKKKGSFNHGIEKLVSEISRELYANHISLSNEIIQHVIEGGTVTHAKAKEIKKIVDVATEKFAQDAVNLLSSEELPVSGRVETCSGGCVLLHKQLVDAGLNVVKDHGEYANAIASYKWLTSK